MTLFDQINADVMKAMKARDKEKLAALRAVKAEFLLLKTAAGNQTISSETEIKTLQKMIKQRKDSAEVYKQQNRDDLYEKEMTDVPYIEAYLPKQMTENDLAEGIKSIIEQTGATSMKDMGKVMGIATKQFAGKAEGRLIASKVKELLGA